MLKHVICAIGCATLYNLAYASDKETTQTGFGGPDAVENTIEDDKREKQLPLREKWANNYGLTMGADYSALGVTASDVFEGADDNAASGMLRFYGAWKFVNKGTENASGLVWKIEHRHSYTDTSVKGFGLGNVGMVGLINPPFSDEGLRLTNLYWHHKFNEGTSSAVGGFLDVTDIFDTFALASPWTGFINFAFSTGTTTMTLPNDAALGAGYGTMLGKDMYVLAGITDINSDATEPFKGFESVIDDHKFYKAVEFGWTESQGRIYLDNFHITLWHADESKVQGNTEDSYGLNYSYVKLINNQWFPFIRGGISKGQGPLMESAISMGFGMFGLGTAGSTLGFGFNWGQPNEDSFGSGFDKQYTTEIFYKYEVSKNFAITPDIQFIKNPALNPSQSSVWIAGLRARAAL